MRWELVLVALFSLSPLVSLLQTPGLLTQPSEEQKAPGQQYQCSRAEQFNKMELL